MPNDAVVREYQAVHGNTLNLVHIFYLGSQERITLCTRTSVAGVVRGQIRADLLCKKCCKILQEKHPDIPISASEIGCKEII